MELIAKVTSKCDMSCTFCAASNTNTQDLTPKEIADTAKEIGAETIILLGGEALCLPPSFYMELLELTTARISFTTNLKGFYLNPDAWVPIFKNKRVGVATSFNYGTGRMWNQKEVYTEEMFRSVMQLFKEKVGYTPMFIGVIDKNNVDTWRDHLKLAEELGTTCKLNNALAIGRQDEYFPRYELFKIWTTIIEEGLEHLEINSRDRRLGRCGFNTNLLCWSTIRVLQKDENGNLAYYNCDEKCNQRKGRMRTLDEYPIVPTKERIRPMKMDCYGCQLYALCNACVVNREQIPDPEKHCYEMKKIEKKLIEQEWI